MNLLGIPAEFFIFGFTLLAVALFHRQALLAAVSGLTITVVYKFLVLGLAGGGSWLVGHVGHEWPTLVNLLLLLVGFAVLANQFELSAIPDTMPRVLPDNWTGGLVLLAIVFCMSAFLDNIAAAIIGGVIAKHVYRGKVTVGFLAGIVAASNAGGAGSVIGDTTTTMIWISGVSPLAVLNAFIASLAAFAVFGPLSALQQQRVSPIAKDSLTPPERIDWARGIIVLILLGTILSVNLIGNAYFPGVLDHLPLLGAGLWIAILATALWRRPHWAVVPGAAKGAVFLIALVALASLMPVHHLPAASWQTALGLGFVSAVFDNIPLTALALRQGGLRLGNARLCRGLRRLDAVVRLVGRRRSLESLSGDSFGRGLGAAWLVRACGLRRRVYRAVVDAGLAPDVTIRAGACLRHALALLAARRKAHGRIEIG